MVNDEQWCFAWFGSEAESDGQTRAALQKNFKWTKGETITVGFLDGDPEVQSRVRAVAREWVGSGMANLDFSFIPDASHALIRISFRYEGSWSLIGTACKRQTDRALPTMNFGWLTKNSSEEELRRVVLHEFGHALGLIHEHQNPGGLIHWNRAQVERDLSEPPNNWTPEEIELNMFQPFERAETNYTALDPQSIMMYPIPTKWTEDGFSVGLNSELSENDKEFIRKEYR
jgi:serralysin